VFSQYITWQQVFIGRFSPLLFYKLKWEIELFNFTGKIFSKLFHEKGFAAEFLSYF